MSTFPLREALVLASCKVSEATVVCFIMPFVNEMVIGFGYSPSSAAEYAGIIESALVFSEAVFAPLWGRLADTYGRKHLLVSGLAAFTVACIGIGLSQSLWMAIVSRCLSGVMGAVSVLIRTIQFELVDTQQLPRFLEILTPCWAIGAAIGPVIGGLLAHPAETMPHLFIGKVWQTYPYLLSATGTAVIPACSAFACWLVIPETLGRPTAQSTDDLASLEAAQLLNLNVEDRDRPLTMFELLREPSLLYPFFEAALLAFVSMGYCAGFMMMASAPANVGGLGLSPATLGLLLATSSILGVLVSTKMLPWLVSRYGYYGALRRTSFSHVALFIAIALSQCCVRLEGKVGPLTGLLLAVVLVLYEIGETSYTFLDVAFADRTPPGCLGSVNGMSASAYSIGRMFAPIASGFLWSWSIALPQPPGSALIWLVYSVIALIWWMSTLRLHSPLERASRSQSDLGESCPFAQRGAVAAYSTFDKLAKAPGLPTIRELPSYDSLDFGDFDDDDGTCSGSAISSSLPVTPSTPLEYRSSKQAKPKMFTVGDWSDEDETSSDDGSL